MFYSIKKILFTLSIVCSLHVSAVYAENNELNEFSAHFEGMAFITEDIEASIDFYTRFIGYRELHRRELTDAASLANFGLKVGDKLPYVILVAKDATKENPIYPSLSFAEIRDAEYSDHRASRQDTSRKSMPGEVIRTYSVKDLQQIEQQMLETGITIIVPLSLSRTGKSRTLTVLDPNGTKIQLFEYIKNTD